MALTYWISTCITGKSDPYFITYIIINSKWITRHSWGSKERPSQEKIDLYMDRRERKGERERKRERSID